MPSTDLLGELVAMSRDQFAERCWGRRHLLVQGQDPGRFGHLFGPDAVDELIARRGLRTPFVRLAREGSTLPDRSFTTGGGVGAGVSDQVSDDKVRREFAAGATIVLQGLHRLWPPITDLAAGLADELGHPVQVNAYVTPPGGRGFTDHYDVHDVFVLQIHGAKRWAVRDPVFVDPLRHQPWTDHRELVDQAARSSAATEATLEPGDCWYLPRGVLHAATGQDSVSIHLTVGVHVWTRHHLAEALLEAAGSALAADPGLRRSLPLGVDVSAAGELAAQVDDVRDALREAVAAVPPDEIARILRGRARSAQRPAPVGPLQQWSHAQSLTADEVVALRPHLMAAVEGQGESAVVRSRAGRVPVPSAGVPAVRQLLAGETLRVRDLMDDTDQARELARELLLAGVVECRS